MDSQSQSAGSQPQSKSGMAIAGFVLGIIALLTSFIPIVNNMSMFLAVLGLIFVIIGLVGIKKGKKSGKGLAIAALIICIISGIVVLATQNMYSTAVDKAFNETTEVETSGNSSSDANQTASVGSAVTLKNGLVLSVDSVEAGLANYDGSAITRVAVTYQNNGSESVSFNSFNWKGEDSQGAQRSTTYYSNAENELNSGSVTAGGTVSGNIYFDGDITKVVYDDSLTGKGSGITWNVA